MRVPKAGQDLIERRIVREGKQLAKAMLSDYADPSAVWFTGLAAQLKAWRSQAMAMLRATSVGH